MSSVGTNSFVHLVYLFETSEAIPIFDNDTSNVWISGFRINKQDGGNFIFIAGRPYRFDNASSFINYDYIIDNWMNSVMVDVNDDTPALANGFHLFQNYPNPFNPSTRLSYSLEENVYVSLKIYDIMGAEVTELVNQKQSPGFYEVQFDASGLSSGIYFYKLKAGDFILIKKMTLLK